jgi:ATP-binding cassette, subfamily A (ABC1), member 3
MLDLLEYKHIRAEKLSGGNKRKLSAAMTLLIRPTVEFLDEPSTGVDPVSRKQMFSMIKQLNESSVLMTTHRMDEAQSLCDQIAIMVNGRILCYGSPAYLMDTYGGGYEATFMIDVGKADKTAVGNAMSRKLPGQFRL